MEKDELKENIEKLSLKIGFSKPYTNTLLKIICRKELLQESYLAFTQWEQDYKSVIERYNVMQKDPTSFYQKNKKLRKTENNLLTFGSLSLSYSFCSPYRLISTILDDAKSMRDYHKFMIETSDENHKLEEIDNWFIEDIKKDKLVNQKYQALLQDLRGNKIPPNLLEELSRKVKLEKRDSVQDRWGLASITKESLVDSFYIFFGSKRGAEFVEEWKNESNRERLKDEFEYLIYNNPYINPAHVDESLETFMSKDHIESAEYFLKKNKGRDRRTDKDECVDFGLGE